jgi:hypothetical protein
MSNPKFHFVKVKGGVRKKGEAMRYDFIHAFNLDMDGTDQADHIRGFSILKYRFLKWTNKIVFNFLLPQVESNIFILRKKLFKERGIPELTHRESRDALAVALMAYAKLTVSVSAVKRKISVDNIVVPVKRARLVDFYRGDHSLETFPVKKGGRTVRGRCAVCSTKESGKVTSKYCPACKTRICSASCYQIAHTPGFVYRRYKND